MLNVSIVGPIVSYRLTLLTFDALSCHIFDIQALWRSALSVTVSGCQKLQMSA